MNEALSSEFHRVEPPISATLDVQKQDLAPEVRSYAENLEAQVRAIFTEYGCQTWEEFLVLAQDAQRVPTEKMREASLLTQTLARVTEHPERFGALKRAEWFTNWYKSLGFDLTIPEPPIVSEEIERRSKLEMPQGLFYRPPTKDMSYEDFMRAVGQQADWTLTDKPDLAKIAWEPTETGYWFWADVASIYPRVRTSRNDLAAQIHLISLEEYIILWHAYKSETNTMLDTGMRTYLRTEHVLSVLSACDGGAGRVYVGRSGLENLGILSQSTGGRASELVKP